MTDNRHFDFIIVGGSYSGLAAGMALGRALRQVLIIDSGTPCNKQTPKSHNFITQDGKAPEEIATLARQQVERYNTVKFFGGLATNGIKTKNGFDIQVASGETFSAKKVIFATGIKDIMPDLKGYAECWGISVLHCPYCHGYEVRNERTGILGNGKYGFEFSTLISNWTKDLTLFTNGESTLTAEETTKIKKYNINIVEKEIDKLEHAEGYIQDIIFKDGTKSSVKALYARCAFKQHCPIPKNLGCELNEEGYIKTDSFQMTTVHGIYACGDNVSSTRTVANAVAMGTTTGMMANKELIKEEFFIELVRHRQNRMITLNNRTLYPQERIEELTKLLETHISTHKQVSQYANMLNLSSYKLNAFTKTTFGKKCSELINDYIILEAKRFLLATSDQVNKIAVHLGYKDVSYFIRFFKKHTGYSPEAFRHNSK